MTKFDITRNTFYGTVQNHPRLKVMVPIDSPGLVSYSTSIGPIVVFVAVLEMTLKLFFQRSNGEN